FAAASPLPPPPPRQTREPGAGLGVRGVIGEHALVAARGVGVHPLRFIEPPEREQEVRIVRPPCNAALEVAPRLRRPPLPPEREPHDEERIEVLRRAREDPRRRLARGPDAPPSQLHAGEPERH